MSGRKKLYCLTTDAQELLKKILKMLKNDRDISDFVTFSCVNQCFSWKKNFEKNIDQINLFYSDVKP